MVMRITENMKFRTAVTSLGNVQSQYDGIMEKMASLKRINRLSDDPLGMTRLLDYRQAQASLEQYQKNIDNSTGWLNITEAKLSSAGDLVTKARELAVGQGTATASAASRRIAAESVEQLKEQMLSLANATFGNRYLFSGSRTGTVPFSSTYQPASIGSTTTSSANIFDGTVAASGVYTGSANKTYVVKIVSGGVLADATYQVSADGGKTWGTEQTDLDTGTISLAEGISLVFTDSGASHLTAGDMFHLDADTAGYYKGNGAALTTDIGKDASVVYNISGEAVFTGSGGGADIFKALDDLKTALMNNDQQGILAQIDKLTEASVQINLSTSKVGTTVNRLDLAKSNLQDLSLQLTDLSSKTEDADMAELATSLAMKQIALQASYATASRIGSNTIMDFIK